MNQTLILGGTVEVDYSVYGYEMDDGSSKYDWTASNGTESDELFDSADEAEQDAKRRLGA